MFIRQPRKRMSSKKILGIGVNDAPYRTAYKKGTKTYSCLIYKKWVFTLEKVCIKKATICDSWLNFMNFYQWVKQQDWKGKELSEKVFDLNNTHYSPETCVFISTCLKLLIAKPSYRKTSTLGEGVHLRRIKNYPYYTSCHHFTGKLTTKYFKTKEDALKYYRDAKQEYLLKSFKEEKDPRLKQVIQKEILKHNQKLLPIN